MEATQGTGCRAAAIGLSAGLGVAVPLAAFAATVPFEGAHGIVTPAAAPFALGALAGVGALAVSSRVLERRAARASEIEEAERTAFSAAFGGAEAASPHVSRAHGHLFKRADEGVPTIARAADALSEDDAWAEIDALLDDGSPVSCDPATSKDIYQIALDELSRASVAGTYRAAQGPASGAPSAPSPAAAPEPVPAASTASFMAVASAAEALAAATASLAATAAPADSTDAFMALAGARPAEAAAPSRGVWVSGSAAPVSEVDDADAARRAALASLGGPAPAAVAHEPVAVPMADYRGHEGMWAAALDILAEDDPASLTGAVAPGRQEAAAEGARATARHTHVNEILEEEIDRAPSPSVRRTGRAYLRVIQGGTHSMPRLRAKA